MSNYIDTTHPPPSSFASRSLTTPTQRCCFSGGGQVPEDGGGWDKDRNLIGVNSFFGFGKCNVINQSHGDVALIDDKAVPSFGAEPFRHLVSSPKIFSSRILSQRASLRATAVELVTINSAPSLNSQNSMTTTQFLKEVTLWI